MSLESLDLPSLLTFVVLLFSAIALWLPIRHAWAVLLVIATVIGYVAGVLTGTAVLPLAVFAAICWFYRYPSVVQHRPAHIGIALLIVVLAVLLSVHVFPGFHNPFLMKGLMLSPDAIPYDRRLNFDKTAVGIIILALCFQELIRSWQEWRDAFRRVWLIVVINTVVVVSLAFVIGYVRFDPKWTNIFWPWAVVMIFSTCLAEEALFRGFIQKELQVRLRTRRFGNHIALGISAVLFGLAHLGGGFLYVFLATIAGIGYGLAFQRSGRIEMSMFAHFFLNSVHFIFFTYPKVA